jgi:hypothetical protein
MPCRSSLNAIACLFQGIVVGLGALTVIDCGISSIGCYGTAAEQFNA